MQECNQCRGALAAQKPNADPEKFKEIFFLFVLVQSVKECIGSTKPLYGSGKI
jgi:hypothetical protein